MNKNEEIESLGHKPADRDNRQVLTREDVATTEQQYKENPKKWVKEVVCRKGAEAEKGSFRR